MVAHSYGTFIASRMVQAHASRVHSLALIDPVCFGEGRLELLAYSCLNICEAIGLFTACTLGFAHRQHPV